MFQPNQKVIILKLYNLKEDGAATIIREINYGRDKGKYVLEVPDSGYIIVEPERLVDAETYWETKRQEWHK